MNLFNRVLLTAITGLWAVFSHPIAHSKSLLSWEASQSSVSLKLDNPTSHHKDEKPPGDNSNGGTPSVTPTPPPPETEPGTATPGTTGSLKGGFCLIAPNRFRQTPTIWHDRPLFVWEGSVSRIEVRDSNNDTVLWSTQPDATASSIQYEGEPLQPGQTYNMIIATTGQQILSFQMMDAQTRDQIAADLKDIEERAQQQGADERSIALARAQYFANKGMEWDALQEAFSTIDPGTDTIAIAALLTCYLSD